MRLKYSTNKKLNILLGNIFVLGKQLKSYQKHKKYFKLLNKKSFKTQIDLEIHKKLSIILKKFNNKPIISEEDKIRSKLPNEFWLIDPIDGTKSLINGFDGYVTQGALMIKKNPVFSFIFAPNRNLLWYALKGKGVFLNGKKIKKIKNFNDILIDNYPTPKGIAKKIFSRLSMKNYIECGSLGLKSALIANNDANLFVKDIKYYDWDIMPALLMIREQKYFMKDLNGNPIKLSGDLKKNNGLIVTNNHRYLKDVMKNI